MKLMMRNWPMILKTMTTTKMMMMTILGMLEQAGSSSFKLQNDVTSHPCKTKSRRKLWIIIRNYIVDCKLGLNNIYLV